MSLLGTVRYTFLSVLLLAAGSSTVFAAESAGEADEVAAQPPKEPPKVVMVRVGDEEITVKQYMDYIVKDSDTVKLARNREGRKQIVRRMIAETLLLEEIKRQSLLPDPFDVGDVNKAMNTLAHKHFPTPPPPPEAELKAYYEAHPDYFGIPAMVRLSHIQFRDDGTRESVTAARLRAEAALERLNKGEDFGVLAAQLSEDQRTRDKKGDLGFVPANLAWVEASVKGLEVGQHTGVIEAPNGYGILLLTDRRESAVLPYAQVRNEVIRRIAMERQEEARDRYVHKLAETSKVVVELEELKDVWP